MQTAPALESQGRCIVIIQASVKKRSRRPLSSRDRPLLTPQERKRSRNWGRRWTNCDAGWRRNGASAAGEMQDAWEICMSAANILSTAQAGPRGKLHDICVFGRASLLNGETASPWKADILSAGRMSHSGQKRNGNGCIALHHSTL